MRKFITIGIVVLLVGGAAAYFGVVRRAQTASPDGAQATSGQGGQAQGQGRGGRGGRGSAQSGGQGGFGGGGFGGPGGGFRPPMTVETVRVKRGHVTQQLTVVGNLIGEQTVDVVPRTAGRLISMNVKLGDRVRRGQVLAKVEDREMVEQVRQAEASHKVGEATIRQREADLNLAQTNVERSRNLYGRQLLPKQTLDDAEARYTSAVAALDLARAQLAQSDARLQELRINLANTNIVSPVDGFVARRDLDVGAFASNNQPVASVVDISSLRLIANVVEKDLRAVTVGDRASVDVDAFPGEKFTGRIARLSPVLDPTTRTATMEVEIANRDGRLKPGMYARVDLTVEDKENVLVVPKIALVDSQGERGVYQPSEDNKAKFKSVKVGIENNETAEILEGLTEGEAIISTGAGALRRDDQLVIAGQPGGGGGGRGNRGSAQGAPGAEGAPGTAPPNMQRNTPEPNQQQAPGSEGRGRGRRGGPPGSDAAGRRPPQSISVQQQRPIA
jgi:RND family efflux transporter MFP subunit